MTYLPEEIFSIVKEFAGIYNLSTPISKLDNDAIDNAYHTIIMWRSNGKMLGGGIADKRKQNIKKHKLIYIYQKRWDYEIAKKMEELCIPTIPDEFEVNDEIVYSTQKEYWCGIITKVNKYSVSIKPYKLKNDIHYYPISDNEYKINKKTAKDITTMRWRVKYYDKNDFGRTRTINPLECVNGGHSIYKNHLRNADNKIKPLWNSGDFAEFVCVKELVCGKNDNILPQALLTIRGGEWVGLTK